MMMMLTLYFAVEKGSGPVIAIVIVALIIVIVIVVAVVARAQGVLCFAGESTWISVHFSIIIFLNHQPVLHVQSFA